MKNDKKLVPKRRFKEFENNDAWEQREFAELVTRVSKSSEETELPRIEYEDIISGQGELNKDIFAKESNKKGIEFEPGDTLFGKLRPYLQNWLLPDFKGIAVGDWWVLRPNEMDSRFIYSLIQTKKYQTVANLSTGTKMPRSDWNLVSSTEFSVSSDLKEQAKIGSFFNTLDNLIILHQRKLEKINGLKSAYITDMFPKEGEKYPKLRFAGFTNAWRQRRLNEVANYRNGKAHENYIDEEGKYVVVNSKFVSTDGRVRKFSNKQNEPLFKNEIAFVLSDVPNGRAIARTFLIEKDDKYTLNQRIAGIAPLENTDPYFLYILMNRHSYFLQFDDGVNQTNLSKGDIEKFESFYPDTAEQTKIGIFFAQLDNLITIHQRKLEKLENIKKAYLNEMFV